MKYFEIKKKPRELRLNINKRWSLSVCWEKARQTHWWCFSIVQFGRWDNPREDDDHLYYWFFCVMNFTLALTRWK